MTNHLGNGQEIKILTPANGDLVEQVLTYWSVQGSRFAIYILLILGGESLLKDHLKSSFKTTQNFKPLSCFHIASMENIPSNSLFRESKMIFLPCYSIHYHSKVQLHLF